MSLKVWLPLNGDLHNQGTNNILDITSTNATTVSNGKIGSCMKIVSTTDTQFTPNFNTTGLSLGGWFRFNQTEIANVINAASYTSTATTPTGNILGNTSYGGIGLVWVGNNHYSSGTFSSMSIFATLRTSTVNNSTSSFTVTFDTWTHIMLTWDPLTHNLSLYKNGELVNTKTFNTFTDGVSRTLYLNYKAIYGGNGPGLNIPIDMNDIRVYDHCLSAAEVKKISQGLVLHYKLDSPYSENTINYVPSPYGAAYTAATPAWNASNHPNAVNVPNWGNGYNGGVSEPAQGYHAMWNIIENIPTIVFQNHNSTIGQTNRWLGVSSTTIGTSIAAGVKYTISYEQRTIDTLGGYTTSGIYYKYNSSSNTNFHDGCPKIGQNTLLNTWQRFSYTFTRNANVDGTGTNGTIYIYGHYGTESTMQIRNIQLEIKDHATGYVISSRADGYIQDSSGYGYNGTVTGNLTIINDTPRYESAINYSSSYIDTPLEITTTDSTISMWLNIPSLSTSYHILDGRNSGGTGKQPIYSYSNGSIQSGGSSAYVTSNTGFLETNKWIFIALIQSGNSLLLYKNGILFQTISCTNTPIIKPTIGARYSHSNIYTGKMSDFRIYATALSADDILQLYRVGVKVDNKQNLHTGEFIEADEELIDTNTTIKGHYFFESPTFELTHYDNTIYQEPDGSYWVRIFHHNNPASVLFSSGANWKNGVYLDADRWFDIYPIVEIMPTYEFMVKQKTTSDATETKYRWVQNVSPLTAVWEDVKPSQVVNNTSSGYTDGGNGGLFIKNGSTHMVIANSNSGNWYGAIGSWAAYNGGIPGYPNTTITTGYMDLYARIYPYTRFMRNTGFAASHLIER